MTTTSTVNIPMIAVIKRNVANEALQVILVLEEKRERKVIEDAKGKEDVKEKEVYLEEMDGME